MLDEMILRWNRLNSSPEARLEEALLELQKTYENLCGRDDFIVSKGLWSEFVDTLPPS